MPLSIRRLLSFCRYKNYDCLRLMSQKNKLEVVGGECQEIFVNDYTRIDADPSNARRKNNREAEKVPDSRLLNVAIIGKTNAGKSVLTNALVGAPVCGVSGKCNTTRRIEHGVTVCGTSQLVIQDTPGFVTDNLKKRDIERTLLVDQENSLKQAEFILVLHDAANEFTRKSLDARLQFLLYRYRHLPSALVLNKMDAVSNRSAVLEILSTLTTGVVDGRPLRRSVSRVLREAFSGYKDIQNGSRQLLDSRNRRQVAVDSEATVAAELSAVVQEPTDVSDNDSTSTEAMSTSHNEQSPSRHDFDFDRTLWPGVDWETLDALENAPLNTVQRNRLKKCFNEQRGWPLFKAVFSISAMNGQGVDELRTFLVKQAKLGAWQFHSSVVSPASSVQLVLENVRATMMDVLRFELPYKLEYKIISWEVNEFGTLCIYINVICDHERNIIRVTGRNLGTLKQASKICSASLSNLFGRDAYVRFTVTAKRARSSTG